MEDDDEFGDLYTDVLQPFFLSSSSTALQPPQASSATAPPSIHRPIDLNIHSDDAGIVNGASQSYPNNPRPPTNQTLATHPSPAGVAADYVPDNSIRRGGVADEAAIGTRVLEAGDAKLRDGTLEDANYGGVVVADNDGHRRQVGGNDEELMDKDVNFDIEEGNTGIGVDDDEDDVGSEPVIPGLTSSVPVRGSAAGDIENVGASRRDGNIRGDDVGGDDWDSDSEDDLQIVLNGPMAMERGGMAGGDDDDEDEDGLVIVTDGDPNQALEEQDWGEDGTQAGDGERKEAGEGGKTGAGIAAAPKIGYSNHGFHPFHSQFKVSVLI